MNSIVLTVFTFGFYYFVWQYRQLKQLNALLGTDENSFAKWLFFSIITFGIYHIYHEYVSSLQIIEIQKKYQTKESHDLFPLICLLISIFGMFLIIDIIHQDEINKVVLKSSSQS